jgi:hypothetical protein
MTERDKNILVDLWRWKLLTTAAITELHFGEYAPSYAYRRLARLRSADWVEMKALSADKKGISFFWTLSRKGFQFIKEWIPSLKEDGFRSEHTHHDLLVNAAHLGEWIYGVPAGCELFSEQELRRLHIDQYPSWVPNIDSHRPDGYWKTLINGKSGTIALEVELKQKSLTDYKKVAQFYTSRAHSLFRVIWIVDYSSTARMIESAVSEIGGTGTRLHNFLLTKEFVKTGWATRVFAGRDFGKPLSVLLPCTGSKSQQFIASSLILNTRKSPHMSETYLADRKKLFSHRLGSSLVGPVPTSRPIASIPNSLLKPKTGGPNP